MKAESPVLVDPSMTANSQYLSNLGVVTTQALAIGERLGGIIEPTGYYSMTGHRAAPR